MHIDVDPDWWKSLFDDVYLITDARSVCNAMLTRLEIDLITQLIPMRPHDWILDLCGGHGRHSVELSKRGYDHCTVLDYSFCLLQHGHSEAMDSQSRIGFVQADARQSAAATGLFHHVLVLGNALGYVHGDSGASDIQILSEAYRALKSNGWLVVDVANADRLRGCLNNNAWHEIKDDIVVCRQRMLDNQIVRARELVLSKIKGIVRDRTYSIRMYTPEELEVLLKKIGFCQIRVITNFRPMQPDQDLGFMDHRMMAVARK